MSVSRVYRLLRLIALLQSGRSYNADQLAEELEVSRRTVFRDLNMLEMARVPYYYDPDEGSYRISAHYFLPPINLTIPEALSLLVLTSRLRSGKLPLLQHASRAGMKVQQVLPAAVREHVGDLMERLTFRLPPVSRHRGVDAVFADLASAIADHKVCRLLYISFHERKQIRTELSPLRLSFIGRAWYVIGHSSLHEQRRTFKLGRIRDLELTDRTFEPPEDFNAEEHFGRAWQMIPEGRLYDVHLHFDAKVAGNVAEVGWHPSQQIEWNDDGSIEFRVTVDGIGEISWWVLGYGRCVEVVSPPELRRWVRETAEATAERHQEDAPCER